MVWLPRKPPPACPPALSQARSLSSCLLPAHFPRGARPHSPSTPSPSSSRGLAPGLWGTGLTGRLTRAPQGSAVAASADFQMCPGDDLGFPAVRMLSGEASRRWHPPSRHVPVAVSPLSHGPRGLPGGRACPSGPPRCPLQRPPPQTSQTSPCSSVRQPAGRVTGAPPRLGLPRAPCRGPLLLFPRPQRWAWPPRAGGQGLHSALYLLKVSFLS